MNYLKYSSFVFCVITVLLLVGNNTNAQHNYISKIDSLKNLLKKSDKTEDIVKVNFAIAEEFMTINRYDSAQIWLNKIAEILPVRQASMSNYLLSSRQAEIYYYNHLIQLGLQESKRAFNIANALKDNLLLADAYNFTGLFYLNLDSAKLAIPYFIKGMEFIGKSSDPKQYSNLSEPHHLCGNLAEAYTKLNKYDSAIVYAKKSLRYATEINSLRGISVALNSLGTNYLKLNKQDSAINYFSLSNVFSKQGNHFDIELLNYSSLARAYQQKQNKNEALQALDSGFNLIKIYPFVNNLFTNFFLDDAIEVYQNYNLQTQLIAVLQQKNNLLQTQIINNTSQMSIILDASLLNETRVLNMQVDHAIQQNQKSKLRLYYLSALILLGVIAFVFYRYAMIQKLQKSRLLNKISKDLHDDVGSSLSSLNLYSTVAAKVLDSNPAKAKEMLQKISNQSLLVMENISDIVWSMKTTSDDTVQLSTKIKNLVTDTLSAAEIGYKINIDPEADFIVNGIAARRTILMIIKEAINNAVKYSHAKNITVTIKKINNTFFMEIKDDGRGFDISLSKATSNGLVNIQKRAKELNGRVEIKTGLGQGTTIIAVLPAAALNNVGW